MAVNPIRYTSRTFNSILADINSDATLSGKPDWFKRIMAGIGDMLTMYNNVAANQSLLGSAFNRRAVAELLELIDYSLSPHSTSSGDVLFDILRTAAFPVNVNVDNLKALSESTINRSALQFESRLALVFPLTIETFTAAFATDILTVARDYTTGELVRLTSTGTLPAPLALATDYYVSRVSATEIKLSQTRQEAYDSVFINIIDAGVGVHSIQLFSASVTLYQQISRDNITVGEGDGTTWQRVDMPDFYILSDTVEITISGLSWTLVDTWANSTPTDRHFRMYYNFDGSSYIEFGNGTYGDIPPLDFIYSDYAYGGRSVSNVSSIGSINVYAGSDTNITAVSNPDEMTGGSDEEGLDDAKRLGPLSLKASNRFITSEDGQTLSEAYTGVLRSKVVRNQYGLLSCQVIIIPDGGGLPSAGLKSSLQAYLIDRTILESIDVRVTDPAYNTFNCTSQMKVLPGYVYANIETYFDLSLLLFSTEVLSEILDIYNDNGIEAAINYINNKWTLSYGSESYVQIERLLDNAQLIDFGSTIQEAELTAYVISSVIGCDYITVTVPAFPIVLASDEVLTDGVMTTTEIP